MPTLTFDKNIKTRKMLVGIANFLKTSGEASYLSRGSKVLDTQKDIRDTKRANVLITLMDEVMDVKEILKQFKNGGVEFDEMDLIETIVSLANQKITKPKLYYPKDGEVIGASSADAIVGRYQDGMEGSAAAAIDRNYHLTVAKMVKKGIDLGEIRGNALTLKGGIVDVSGIAPSKEGDVINEANAKAFVSTLLQRRNKLKRTRSALIQGKMSNADFTFVLDVAAETVIDLSAAYNIYDAAAIKKFSMNITNSKGEVVGVSAPDAVLDGTPVIFSKQLPKGVEGYIQYAGSATSVFALKKHINFDKAVGVNAYGISMEFEEGVGVWLPQLIELLSNDNTLYPAQDKAGFPDLLLEMNQAETTGENKDGSAGLGDGKTGSIITLKELTAMTVAQLEEFAKTNDIDLSGAADKAAKLAAIKTQLGF